MAEWLSWLANMSSRDTLFTAFFSYSLLVLLVLLLSRSDGRREAIALTYDTFGPGVSGLIGWLAALFFWFTAPLANAASRAVLPPAGLPPIAYIVTFLGPAVTALFVGVLVERMVRYMASNRQWTGRKSDWMGASVTFLGGAAVVPLLIFFMAIFRP